MTGTQFYSVYPVWRRKTPPRWSSEQTTTQASEPPSPLAVTGNCTCASEQPSPLAGAGNCTCRHLRPGHRNTKECSAEHGAFLRQWPRGQLLTFTAHLSAVVLSLMTLVAVTWGQMGPPGGSSSARKWWAIQLTGVSSPAEDAILVQWTDLEKLYGDSASIGKVSMSLTYTKQVRTTFYDGFVSTSNVATLVSLGRHDILKSRYEIRGASVDPWTWYSVCLTWAHGPMAPTTDCLTLRTDGSGEVVRRHSEGHLYSTRVTNVTLRSAQVEVQYNTAVFTLEDVQVYLRDSDEGNMIEGTRTQVVPPPPATPGPHASVDVLLRDSPDSLAEDRVVRYDFAWLNKSRDYDVCSQPQVVYTNAAAEGSGHFRPRTETCRHRVIRTYERRVPLLPPTKLVDPSTAAAGGGTGNGSGYGASCGYVGRGCWSASCTAVLVVLLMLGAT